MDAILIPLQLILAMVGMGATLDLSDFGRVLRQPAGLLVGLGLQWLFVPALAWLFIGVFGLTPGWAVGLVLVACVPGGASSNLFTFIARADVPLSIATTLVTTAGCVLSAPIVLSVIAREHLPADFVFPIDEIFRDIALYLMVPLAAGMTLRRRWPSNAERLSVWAIRGSMVTLGLIALSALGTGKIRVEEYGLVPPARVFLFAFVLAYGTPQALRAMRLRDTVTTALTIEVGVRNVAIALLLMRYFFPGQPAQGEALFTCLFYSGAAFPLAVLTIWRGRRGASAAIGRSSYPASSES